MLAALVLTMSKPMDISVDRLRSTLNHLATYPTRNTNTPECKSAVEWVADRFREIPGLIVEIMPYTVSKGRRVPEDRTVYQVLATLPGTTSRRVMMGAHLDTINLSGDPMTAKAPGINDDGSGIAATLEVARILSSGKWKNTLVFVAFTGEEQGLFGSTALAEWAKKDNWPIDALLSNDTIGASRAEGRSDTKRVRIYSEESADHQSRELARFLEWNARGKLKGFSPWLVLRKDRFQRGGDHSPFNKQGFTAIRLVEALEAFEHHHTEKDTLEHIDLTYLANVTRLNIMTMSKLANAGAPPRDVRYDPKQSYDTTLHWRPHDDSQYIVYWRSSDSTVWQGSAKAGAVDHFTVKGVNKDDHIFAVGAVGGIPVSAG